ncbi:hypothetical protein PAUR_a1682 [Pseudoalteromonas aurantia 208]|uniref:Uncharacterized protein n=1 Tax=Pseudoalteromonas aurantia 208 TaxID=1314867 RepID=A0ABR9EAZ1_9GAMM|nr:hypothetical protein [Pseudoalteromonas aurantia 208]
MRFFFPSTTRPFFVFDNAAPVAPVVAIHGTKIKSPGKTTKDFTKIINSLDPKTSALTVETKKVTTHIKAVTAAIRCNLCIIFSPLQNQNLTTQCQD